MREPGERPKLWTSQQCAAYLGVSRSDWLAAVRQGDAPKPVADHGIALWAATEVRAIQRNDEWTAQEASKYHGINVSVWDYCVRTGQAPEPVRHAGHRALWSRAAVQELNLDDALWEARQCASFHGITLRAWKLAVSDGEVPPPDELLASRRPAWKASTVRKCSSLW